MRQEIEETYRAESEETKSEYELKLNLEKQRHDEEIRSFIAKFDEEKATWQANFVEQQRNLLKIKEEELRQNFKRSADEQIEKILKQFESSAKSNGDELEQSSLGRIR